MSSDNSIDYLFKEHSLDEIEQVRDNLASEIEKRTEQLKSIVKEKYRDIVETSDAIQSMKLNLKEVEQSLWSLDKNITDFYKYIREPQVEATTTPSLHEAKKSTTQVSTKPVVDNNDEITGEDLIRKLSEYSSHIWDHFDSENLKDCVKCLDDAIYLLENNRSRDFPPNQQALIVNSETTIGRTKEMIKNNLWHRIQSAAPDQIGIIAGSEQENLYQLSLNSCIEFLVGILRKDLMDLGYHVQIRRYQPCSYFNTKTNELEPDSSDLKPGLIQLPKYISPELSSFLYKVCKVVNTIVGFNINRAAIVESLRLTIESILIVYTDLVPLVNELTAETKRKRAIQLYFDLLYLRILLNTSKNIDLIETLDPKIVDLAANYEIMLDSIELYMISAALHSNVMILSQSTIRLNGLLIPHLQ